MLDLESLGTGYSPGYVLHDGYLILGTTESSLESIVEAQKGEEDSLASAGEYERALGHLPNERPLLAWINLQFMVTQLGASEIGLSRSDYRMLRESTGSLAFSAFPDGNFQRFTLVVTLFPDG